MLSTGPLTAAVCIITFHRPDGLERTLASLERQQLSRDVRIFVVVCDNSPDGSATERVQEWQEHLDIRFVHHPHGGIPGARNASLREAGDADVVLTLDDDEWAAPHWVATMLGAAQTHDADLLTGPVVPALPEDAPRWSRGSSLFGAVRGHADGSQLSEAFTGNLLLTRRVLDCLDPWFDERLAYSGGSDIEFTRRAVKAGFSIRWVGGAEVHETVPRSRLTLRWVATRGYRIGNNRLHLARMGRGTPGRAASLALSIPFESAWGLLLVVSGIFRPPLLAMGVSRLARAFGTLGSLVGSRSEPYRAGR